MRSDLLLESILALLRNNPWSIFLIIAWALRGRAYLKARLAERFDFDPSSLPYRHDVLEYLETLAGRGQPLILATASHERLASRIAEHLRIFQDVIASSETRNLKGPAKLAAIEAHCGGSPFMYVGDHASDLHIWRRSQAAVLVAPSRRTAHRAASVTAIAAEFPRDKTNVVTYLRAIRAYQWSKNLLVFVPLITAHLWSDVDAIIRAAIGFLSFSMCASTIYVFNDLIDLPADRAHPRKRMRPIAAGTLSIQRATLAATILLGIGLALAAQLDATFLMITVLYVVATTAYSLTLKTYVLIDVITLAGLYTFRIIAGAVAVSVVPSFWLLAFSMFMFLSLALVKRYSELLLLQSTHGTSTRGRDYATGDQAVVQGLGIASGFAAVLVLALYIDSEDTTARYEQPEMLWLLCVTVLYWLGRMWVKASRNEMHDDPLLFATRDRGSLIMLAISIAILIAAT